MADARTIALTIMQLHVSRARTRFLCSPEERAAVRQEFDRHHCLLLPQFLDSGLVDEAQPLIEGAESTEITHDVGHEIEIKAPRAKALLELLVNDHVLFEAIDAVTGCGSIGSFAGRIYEMRSGGDHEFAWHTDVVHDRLIAMSVNLGSSPYAGGILEIADASKVLLHSVANTGTGDAVIFRVSPDLMHRVTPVEGSTPKRAFAGWFRSRPSYHEVLGALRTLRAD